MTGITPTTVNPEQRTAIEHGDGPLLIVAGAGTGKTTVITQRIAWLILERKIPTDGVLALTFTDKSATEMEERVDQLLPYGYVNLWVSTFHAFCERILRQHALDIGLPGDFTLLSQTEQWLLIRRNLDRFQLDYYRPLGNPTKFIGALLKHFSRLEDEDVTPDDYLAYARSLQLDRGDERPSRKSAPDDPAASEAKRILELAQAYATYRQLLLDGGFLDFGSLITSTLQLFQQRPQILARYREQFRYLLVDEFQDTNWAQYELIKLLAAPRNNLTVVGDDDQSIYKFRGASVANILAFRHDYPNCAQVVLTVNYRSRQNILDRAYQFIQQNNPNRLEVALRRPAGGRGKRKASVQPTITKQLRAAASGDGEVAFLHYGTQEQEARGVVEQIIERKERSELPWSEFAILVRANDQAELFTQQLEAAGIPYQFVASKGLYRKPDVLDCLAFLRLLDNYHESPALYRVLSLESFGIAADDVVELAAYARQKGISLYQALVQHRAIPHLAAPSRQGMDHVLTQIRQGSAAARSKRLAALLIDFLEAGGVLRELGRSRTMRALERAATINKFLEEVAQFEQLHPRASVPEFVAWFDLKLESGDAGSLAGTYEPDLDAVRVMTVHGAKGLEFTHVFIVQLVDRRFPTTERKDPIEVPNALVKETLPEGDVHLEEERRLLYVAMTRAKAGLFLTAAEDYGGSRAKNPSRFLYELGFIQESTAREPRPLARLARRARQPVGASDLRFLGSKYSFSALRSYEKCPWQFRYAYVLRVPVRGKALTSFGETLHRTLQRFFELIRDRRAAPQGTLLAAASPAPPAGSPVTLDELLGLYDASFIDAWYADETERERYRTRGREALTRFYERHVDRWPDVLALEQTFNLKVDRYTLAGKIDRVDRLGVEPNDQRPRVGVVDYKSGRSRTMEREDRYQLLIYALAAQDPNVLNARVGRLTYEFLEDGQTVEVDASEGELAATEAWIRRAIASIQSGDFSPTPGMVCRFCDYRAICEHRDPNY